MSSTMTDMTRDREGESQTQGDNNTEKNEHDDEAERIEAENATGTEDTEEKYDGENQKEADGKN